MTLAQVLSCEFCEISKNTFFTKQLQETASLTILSNKTARRLIVEREDLGRPGKLKIYISQGDQKTYYLKVFQMFSHRETTDKTFQQS